MSRSGDLPLTRRERRAAARQAASGTPRRPSRTARFAGIRAYIGRSPIMALTGGVVIVAVLAIATLTLLQAPTAGGAAQPGTRTAAGILVPTSGTPEALVTGRDIGMDGAPLTLTVWSDFQCPACRLFAQTIEPRLITEYVAPGKLRIQYRDFLIIGPESHSAAVGARCADRQGLFWPYHDVLFANQAAENSGALTAKRLVDMADAIGLARGDFEACVADDAMLEAAEAESRQGHARAQSTPTLDFGSFVFAGSPPYPQLTAKIDELLAATSPK
jgi:protein-disulfide isomerase